MIFAKRYKDLVFEPESNNIHDVICGEINYKVRQKLVAVIQDFAEPMILHPDRYDYDNTIETDAFLYACAQFNDIMGVPYIQASPMEMFSPYARGVGLENWCVAFIFSVAELEYDNLSDGEKSEYSSALNAFFEEYDLPWKMLNGKMIKIDAQQFECDVKAKALEQMKELKDAEPKFQSAFIELTTAVEALENGDYQSAINNAGKSYESVLKVILGFDKGSANELTQKYKDTLLRVPATMPVGGFESQVMKSLPFIRNNSGADHGAGAKEVVISKPMAKLAVNLAAALDTYLIEEYAESNRDT